MPDPSDPRFSRRAALAKAAALAAGGAAFAQDERGRLDTLGVILYPWEVAAPGADWPARAAAAGVTTIALHAARRPDLVRAFVASPAGTRFLEECRARGIGVEYELHAVGTLLSREASYEDETLFRQERGGRRNADSNLCTSNPEALRRTAAAAVELCRELRSTTGRYFLWPDDAGEWCQCERCRELSATDQSLRLENAIVAALRTELDPGATLAHLAYHETLSPPESVAPHPGLFLEFAPIRRNHAVPLDDPAPIPADVRHPGDWMPASNADYLALLDANLKQFPAASAQLLEYYLDVSYFARWRRGAVERLAFDPAVIAADARLLADRGVRQLTTFALWLDVAYVSRFGPPPLARYAAAAGE